MKGNDAFIMYILREIEKTDMPVINKWRKDPELIQKLCAPYRYINQEVDDAWFDNYIKSRDSAVRCAIVQTDINKVIGCVYLLNIDWTSRCADFGIMIGEKDNQGKGAGTFAVKAILDHAFFNLNLHRIQLEVLEHNERAIQLYHKFGFQKEGVKREALFKNGVYVNLIAMAVLRKEYHSDRTKGNG